MASSNNDNFWNMPIAVKRKRTDPAPKSTTPNVANANNNKKIKSYKMKNRAQFGLLNMLGNDEIKYILNKIKNKSNLRRISQVSKVMKKQSEKAIEKYKARNDAEKLYTHLDAIVTKDYEFLFGPEWPTIDPKETILNFYAANPNTHARVVKNYIYYKKKNRDRNRILNMNDLAIPLNTIINENRASLISNYPDVYHSVKINHVDRLKLNKFTVNNNNNINKNIFYQGERGDILTTNHTYTPNYIQYMKTPNYKQHKKKVIRKYLDSKYKSKYEAKSKKINTNH